MNRLAARGFAGLALALGLLSMPARAQQEGDSHGDRPHAETSANSTTLPKCPVTGEPINLAVSEATDDGPVFFCCKNCISRYRADPAKYATKIAAQRKALAHRPRIQVTCPVSKEPVDTNVFVESAGEKIFFCCKDCVTKYQSDPAKYASALANSYTYQTKCPVMNEDIDPKSFATAGNGMKLYFCCKGCDKKFFKDPQKYTANLEAQGFTVNAREMAQVDNGHRDHEHHGHDHGEHAHDQ